MVHLSVFSFLICHLTRVWRASETGRSSRHAISLIGGWWKCMSGTLNKSTLHFLSSRHVEVQHMMGLELLVSYTDINSKLITFHYSYQPMLVYNEPKLILWSYVISCHNCQFLLWGLIYLILTSWCSSADTNFSGLWCSSCLLVSCN